MQKFYKASCLFGLLIKLFHSEVFSDISGLITAKWKHVKGNFERVRNIWGGICKPLVDDLWYSLEALQNSLGVFIFRVK